MEQISMEQRIIDYIRQDHVKCSLRIPSGTEITVQRLGMGKFHEMYIIKAGNNRFVFRLNMYPHHEFTNKTKREYNLLKSLEYTGIGPVAFFLDVSRQFFDKRLVILEYIKGEELKKENLTDEVLVEIAKRYAMLHKIVFERFGPYPPEREPPISLCTELRSYLKRHDLELLRQLESTKDVMKRFGDLLEEVMDRLEEHDDRYKERRMFNLLKGDNKLSNIIINKEGRVRFIDWEFAKAGINLMDIANFLSFAGLDQSRRKLFLDTYSRDYGQQLAEEELRLFTMRDFALRSIWTLNKVSEHHSAGNEEGFMASLELLKKKVAKLPKYL